MPKSAISNEATEEALAIYDKLFASKTGGSTSLSKFSTFGVPKRDLDGSSIRSKNPNVGIFYADPQKRKKAFQQIATLYGTEEALDMTRILPNILAFNADIFKPSLDEFATIFGEEEAKAMILRNPGLLAVKPVDAARSDDSTMVFSYIIAITRPAGAFLLFGLLSLLMVPVLEGITGVSKADFLSSLGV